MSNKVVLITAARRGLGKATAIEFAKKGYDVVINDREDKELVMQVTNEIEKKYDVKSIGIMADISKENEVKEMFVQINKCFGKIDVVVNNAGIVYDMPLAERSVEIFNETVNNNLTGTYIVTKEAGKYMLSREKGKIINITSTNGINAFFPTSIDYDASKAGIISLTHNFALEFAPYINVNAVAPGWINTSMNDQLSEEVIKTESEKIYLKRFAEPEEVAKLVVFLASDDANYINGEIIKIDGGY